MKFDTYMFLKTTIAIKIELLSYIFVFIWAISSIDIRMTKTLQDRRKLSIHQKEQRNGGRKIDLAMITWTGSLAAARATMNKWRDTSRMACQENVGLLAINQASTEAYLARGSSSKASLWGHARSALSCQLREL